MEMNQANDYMISLNYLLDIIMIEHETQALHSITRVIEQITQVLQAVT